MKVFWCRSHLVWLVLSVPSLHALVKNFCNLLLLLFLVLLFRICKREERWEGRSRGRCMVSKVRMIANNIELFVHIIKINKFKWNCESNHHTSLSMGV